MSPDASYIMLTGLSVRAHQVRFWGIVTFGSRVSPRLSQTELRREEALASYARDWLVPADLRSSGTIRFNHLSALPLLLNEAS